MKFASDPAVNAAGLRVCDPVGESRTVELAPDVFASVDEQGTIYALELLDATRWGTPFDETAATRALDWARKQLTRTAHTG